MSNQFNTDQTELLTELVRQERETIQAVLGAEEYGDEDERLELVERLQSLREVEGAIIPQSSQADDEYEDSSQFTDELSDVSNVLNSERVANWMKETDYNFGTKTKARLAHVQIALAQLWDELDKAE